MPGFAYRPWEDFANLTYPEKGLILKADLVDVAIFRKQERVEACRGADPIEVVAAYAQNHLVYTKENYIEQCDAQDYEKTPMQDRVNKFTQAYPENAPLLLHKALADIVVDAAIALKLSHGFRLRIYDGLRTMEAAYTLYRHAKAEWLGYDAQGNKTLPTLLSEPGDSAHNRGLAVDTSLLDEEGREFERFDNLNMEVSHRDYRGDVVSAQQRNARMIKERAFQRTALARGTLLAPLRSEYWDDRMPGRDEDLWRVMESICRCIGVSAPAEKAKDYEQFVRQWQALDADLLVQVLGESARTPPPYAQIIFHEKFNVIYGDRA